MKQCTRCNCIKTLDEFGNRAASLDGLMSACKDCRRAHDNQTYRNNPDRRKRIRESNDARRLLLMKKVRQHLLEHPCVDCGQADPELLEFDHLEDKVAGIGIMVQRCYSWETISEEIKKCEVRCLYCHRKRTIIQFGWYAALV